MDTKSLARKTLARKIAGEIVLSEEAGRTIQKWRNIFKITQRRLADEMGIMPSVISDYENGRRKSPGIKMIKRIVEGLITIDERAGGKIIHEFAVLPTKAVLSKSVLDMKEFEAPIEIKDFCKIVEAPVIVRKNDVNKQIYGYTIIDALKAITDLSPMDMVKLYGMTTERALIFINSHSGRSSMVALKVTNLRPGLVVFQGPEKIDDLAKRIGELEGIPIGITKIKNSEDLLRVLKKRF